MRNAGADHHAMQALYQIEIHGFQKSPDNSILQICYIQSQTVYL